MKKLIAMLVVGGFLAATLVGCGPATTSAPEKTGPGGSGTGPGGTSAAAPKTTTGEVTDWTKPDLKVKTDAGDEKKFSVPDTVTVDAKKGDKVTVTEDGGKVTKVEKK